MSKERDNNAATDADVMISTDGGLGRIVLNRPKAINALNHSMVRDIAAALTEWADDDTIRTVVITGAGERGLCAGGDIVSIYHDAKDGGAGSQEFWRDEYVLNAVIARYRKPYVAIMDGIVMGGGVGISAHGSVRIVTERSKIGMPETGIGFVPDVGGTYLLARSPGEIGTHIALATARMDAGDAIACGFADHFISSDAVNGFIEALTVSSIEDALARFVEPVPASELLAQQDWIDAAYSADSVAEIVSRLEASGVEAAALAAAEIRKKSPVACAITLQSLRHARRAETLEEVLDTEFRVSVACLNSHDLVEGIRAKVIDKDRNPQWRPSTLDDVSGSHVASFFAPLGDQDLGLTHFDTTPGERR